MAKKGRQYALATAERVRTETLKRNEAEKDVVEQQMVRELRQQRRTLEKELNQVQSEEKLAAETAIAGRRVLVDKIREAPCSCARVKATWRERALGRRAPGPVDAVRLSVLP